VKAKKATSGFLTLVLLAGLVVTGLTPANAALRVPKAPFKACSEVADASLYCVDSVSIQTADGIKISLIYVPSGQEVPSVAEAPYFKFPVAKMNGNVVEWSDSWMDRYQIDIWNNPNLWHMDVSALIGTPNHPEQGSIFDPNSNTFDVTVPLEAWDATQVCDTTGASTQTTRKDCKKGSIVSLIDNKVVFVFDGPDAAWATQTLAYLKGTKFVEFTALAEQKLQPAKGATYNSTTKTFSKTEPLVVSQLIKDQAIKNGRNLPGVDPIVGTATGTTKDASGTSATPVDTQTSIAAKVEAGRALPGRWTTSEWSKNGLDSLGYDGLYFEAKAANEFVNHLFIDGLPTITGGDKKVSLASQIGSKGYAANLDPDVTISVTVRSGEIRTGVIMASAIDVETDTRYLSGFSTITITGSPVTVPLAKSAKDCTLEDSVAKANVRQFQATVIVQNDTSGFGVDGTSGDMYVGTNGVCEGSTPVWNEQTKEFTWTAAAPHFAADGKTVNKGFYKAVIPVNDAKLLWGMTNPNDAATALRVSVTTETGGSTAAISVIAVRNGKIIIDVSNFDYSRKKLTIALKKGYKPSLAAKKTTITCVLGKTTKKITAVKPSCPKGYLRKR
jgi:hypothetical protein